MNECTMEPDGEREMTSLTDDDKYVIYKQNDL